MKNFLTEPDNEEKIKIPLDASQPLTEEDIDILQQLFDMDELYYGAFFACALTKRGRTKLRELKAEKPELFELEEEELVDRLMSYEFLYKTGLSDIDHCVLQMLTLYHNETIEGESPTRTLTIVKSAYPKLYSACKGSGNATSLPHLFVQYGNVDQEKDVEIYKTITSEGMYVLCLLYWLHFSLGKAFIPFDVVFAIMLIEVMKNQSRLTEMLGDPILGKEQKQHVKELRRELIGKSISCVQLFNNDYLDEDQIIFYRNLFEAAGNQVDLLKRLEAYTLTDDDLIAFVDMEHNHGLGMEEIIIPYLIIKQFIDTEETLQQRIESLQEKLNETKSHIQPVAPESEQLKSSQEMILSLQNQLNRSEQDRNAAEKRERGLMAELSKARKEIAKKESEILSIHSERIELAELREALYEISRNDADQVIKQENVEISFPYNDLPKGIVCFGGHEQWIMQMQQKLPNVRFVPVDYRYDSSIIRRAPCVWIQPYYLSHKMYNRIIADARSVGVDCHYFRSLSTQSSAIHMVNTMSG